MIRGKYPGKDKDMRTKKLLAWASSAAIAVSSLSMALPNVAFAEVTARVFDYSKASNVYIDEALTTKALTKDGPIANLFVKYDTTNGNVISATERKYLNITDNGDGVVENVKNTDRLTEVPLVADVVKLAEAAPQTVSLDGSQENKLISYNAGTLSYANTEGNTNINFVLLKQAVKEIFIIFDCNL